MYIKSRYVPQSRQKKAHPSFAKRQNLGEVGTKKRYILLIPAKSFVVETILYRKPDWRVPPNLTMVKINLSVIKIPVIIINGVFNNEPIGSGFAIQDCSSELFSK